MPRGLLMAGFLVLTAACDAPGTLPDSEANDAGPRAEATWLTIEISDEVKLEPGQYRARYLAASDCAPSGRCEENDAVSRLCTLSGRSEVVFEHDDRFAYLRLVPVESVGDDGYFRLGLQEGSSEQQLDFATQDGRLAVHLVLQRTGSSRGRATGPALLGDLQVTLDGEPLAFYEDAGPGWSGPYDCQ